MGVTRSQSDVIQYLAKNWDQVSPTLRNAPIASLLNKSPLIVEEDSSYNYSLTHLSQTR